MKKILFMLIAFSLVTLVARAQQEGDGGKTYYDAEKTKPKEVFSLKESVTFNPANPKEMTNTYTKHGPYFYYYENGKLKVSGQYKDGQKHGEWKYYDANGKQTNTERYNNGQLVQ